MESCGRWKWMGSYFVLVTVTIVGAIASFAVLLRASLDANRNSLTAAELHSAGIFDDKVQLGDNNGADSFRFLISRKVIRSIGQGWHDLCKMISLCFALLGESIVVL